MRRPSSSCPPFSCHLDKTWQENDGQEDCPGSMMRGLIDARTEARDRDVRSQLAGVDVIVVS